MAQAENVHLFPLADTFEENETERAFLVSKPTCFLIVGKPGTGKATLGKKLSQSWNCNFIEAKELINEHIKQETEQGIMIQELLYKGQSVQDELIIQLIVDKINSAEVAHHGYVLSGLPSLSEEFIKIPEQIELIKNFKFKPDVIINIKCPDKDLSRRLSGLKQDPGTGRVYKREEWDPALKEKKKHQEGEEEGEEEEEEELEEEEEEFDNSKDVLNQLVYRPEDFPENVEERIRLYKDTLLRPVEDLMINHDPQYLIELDGNKKPDELFVSVLSRLDSLGLRHGAVVMKLYNQEEEESVEGLDGDELMRTLSSYHMIAPRYRWRRSRWGTLCPVALKEGYIKKGLAEFAVSFLDKMYVLSSEESLIKFKQNPRPYLLPPMPLPPCKVAVLGPKSSGKTTVCNLIADKYSGKVFDMSVLIIPYMEEAKQIVMLKAGEEATEKAIDAVKQKIQQETLLKAQEAQKETEKEGEPDEISSQVDEDPSEKDSEDLDTTEKTPVQKEELIEETEEQNVLDEAVDQAEEVTADHPEVRQMVEEALRLVQDTPITLNPDIYVSALDKAIKEFNEQNKERFPGAPTVGGWVLDNFPNSPNYWIPLAEKGLLPDTVICLKNSADNGKYLINRLYFLNEKEVNNNILQRLQKERARKIQEEEEARKEQQEVIRLQEEEKKKLEEMKKQIDDAEEMQRETEEQGAVDADQLLPPEPSSPKQILTTNTTEPEIQSDTEQPEPEQEIVLPEVPEGGYPDVPEIEPLKQLLNTFNEEWQLLEPVFTDSSQVNVTFLEVADKSPERFLQEAVTSMERPFQYQGWEMTSQDIDEEAEDLQAELEAEEEEEEHEEEEGEEAEEDADVINEKKKHFGDSKHFCPVVLKDNGILHPGNMDYAAIYKEKTYYFSSPEARKKFLDTPQYYVAHEEPLQAPPLRVLLIGTSGSGKTVTSRWLADKLSMFHVQFKERLQEIMLSKLEKKIGPQFEEDGVEDDSEEEKAMLLGLDDGDTDENRKENNVHPMEEVILTEEEEAVKSYLADNDPLPTEVLDQLVLEWWTKEPFHSTGFVLDGFPSTVEEVQYIGDRGLYPDIAIFLEADESDICDRLLPPRLAKWQERQRKKEERKQRLRDMKKKIRDEQIAKRRAELLAEQKINEEKTGQKDTEGSDEGDDEEEGEEEEEVDNIELILAEEFPEEEEEEQEEEEQEEDATERMKSEIGEKCEADAESLQSVKEELQSLNIPCVTINASRKPHIVHFQLFKKLKHLVENRVSLFEKGYPVSLSLASKMLHVSYKHPSIFGRWDPVKLCQGEVIQPFRNQENPGYPLIYRQYIYFFSTKENRDIFMRNPIQFIRQQKPHPTVPIRIAILGPPKSGKTTVAKMFTSIYGLQRLSIGDAMRSVLENQPNTELALDIKGHLEKGMVVPDDLAIRCLEIAMMDLTCNTTGIVFDGYPATKQQADLLEACSIIPIKIFELELPVKEVLRRGLQDKKEAKSRPYPVHDSAQILSVRNSNYKQEINRIKDYYVTQHQNWCEVDAMRSKWWVSNKMTEEARASINQIQTYLENIKKGKAAAIADFCITPHELLSRLGEFGQYCPVSLAQRGELFDCSVTSSLQFAAEFRGHYYKMASQDKLDAFLQAPELYVPPLAPRPFPPPEMLPKRLTVADVKSKFPKNAEMRGFCPVTYVDGKKRYEALVSGHIENAVEYRDKIYIFESQEKLQRFMRLPEKYWNHKLPSKLPPKMEPIMLTSLPLTGYLEQGAATAVIKALNDVGCLKPKYPFLSVKRSALLYIAYHLKAYNPRNSDYIRKKYKKKMEQFVECCELITYLGNKMTLKYKEPQRRPIDFDYKMQSFLSLKKPTCT